MDLRLYPAPLRGAVTPPPSKSLLHRQLICLAQAGQFPCPPDPADDVLATVRPVKLHVQIPDFQHTVTSPIAFAGAPRPAG